ncbi:MAG: hypothetical protein IJ833_04330, partial [Lachnospiraceae bacterium]|nr:hypothetical protein [Lachnospiraceae bacterium]
NASTSTNANVGANATQAVQATPEVTPSSTAEVASSEADQPASQESTVAETASSAEAVVDNPNIIGGIDFTRYNNLERPMYWCLKEQNAKFEKLTAIITIEDNEEGIRKAEQISYDGDSYVGKLKPRVAVFIFGSKEIKDVECNKPDLYVVTVPKGANYGRGGFYGLYTGGENEEITHTVTYVDDTKESITLYFTLD